MPEIFLLFFYIEVAKQKMILFSSYFLDWWRKFWGIIEKHITEQEQANDLILLNIKEEGKSKFVYICRYLS
jgi:hypothetical protein